MSARALAEQALRENEEHYRSMFDNMLNGLAYCKMTFEQDRPRDFTYLAVNGTFELLTGLHNVTGKNVSDVIPGIRQSDPELFETYGRVALTGVPERFEIYVNALAKWFSVSAYSPKKEHFMAVFEDITERKKAEIRLRESEERYRVAIEHSNDGVSIVRGDTRIYVNQKFLDIFGYARTEEVIGKPLSLTIHPDDRRLVAGYARRGERGEPAPDRYEFTGVTKDGAIRHIEASVASITYLGERAGLAYFRDVTERKEAEKALEESESRFRAAFEASGIGMALVALDGRWLKVNRSLCNSIGYSEQELLGKTSAHITHPDDLENDLEHVRKLTDDQIPYYQLEKRYYHKEGYIVWVSLSVSLVRDARGHPLHFVAQIEDITERKLLEAKLQTMSIMDELTGLYNRRGFFELGQEQLRLASRTKEKFLLFFADLDHMKWINDTLGHQEGDATLVAVARLLRDSFRESDIIARMGGDEFAILAIGASDGEEEGLLTRLRDNTVRFNSDYARNFPISISVGIGRHNPGEPGSLEALILQADALMYEEKRRKRDLWAGLTTPSLAAGQGAA
jgi:diguanylate cyclase (GGDEF)-like protein/PAS domain S-box-containing protein